MPDLTSFSALTDSNVRSAGPRFKRIVFISLKPGGPNLPLADQDESDADFFSAALSTDSTSDADYHSDDASVSGISCTRERPLTLFVFLS